MSQVGDEDKTEDGGDRGEAGREEQEDDKNDEEQESPREGPPQRMRKSNRGASALSWLGRSRAHTKGVMQPHAS